MPAKKRQRTEEQILTDEELAQKRARHERNLQKQREWRLRNREKLLEQRRRDNAANPEKHREWRRRKRARDPEKLRRQQREGWKRYYERHIEEVRAAERARRAKLDPETRRERERRYRAANREKVRALWKRTARRRASIKRIRSSPEEVYRLAVAALPRGLPGSIRDDVVSSLCLAVLEGEINVNDIAAKAKEFLRAYNREYDTFQTVSLDVLIPGTKTTYLDALVAE